MGDAGQAIAAEMMQRTIAGLFPPVAQTFDYGATPTYTFTPEPGYHVKQVFVDGAPVALTAANEYTFPVLADHAISVEFAIDTFTLTPSVVGGAAGHGTISPTAETTFDYGATPTYTFTPEPGYHVKQVFVDGAPVALTAANEYTFPVLADHAISVEFAPFSIGISSPTAASYSTSGSVWTVTWTVNPAVSVGEFRAGLVDAAGTRFYAYRQVPPVAGKTSYAAALTVNCPPGAGYRAYVCWRPTVGSGPWTTFVKSAAFTVGP